MNCPTPPGGSERESLCKGAGHADGEIQAGANRDAAAADGSGCCQWKDHPQACKEAEIALTELVSTPCALALPIRH
jgi:hypothetical protein